MELFGNTLKNNALDLVLILGPLTDPFESEFRTDVVTCETHSSEFRVFRNLEVHVLGRSPSLRAPAVHGVSSCMFSCCAKRSFRPWVPENRLSSSAQASKVVCFGHFGFEVSIRLENTNSDSRDHSPPLRASQTLNKPHTIMTAYSHSVSPVVARHLGSKCADSDPLRVSQR